MCIGYLMTAVRFFKSLIFFLVTPWSNFRFDHAGALSANSTEIVSGRRQVASFYSGDQQEDDWSGTTEVSILRNSSQKIAKTYDHHFCFLKFEQKLLKSSEIFGSQSSLFEDLEKIISLPMW